MSETSIVEPRRVASVDKGRSAVLPTHVVLALLVVFTLVVVVYPLGWLFAGIWGLPDEFTTSGITRLFTDSRNLHALINTLILAIGAGILSVLFGAPLAWLAARTDLPGRKILHGAVATTFITPAFLIALGYTTLAAPTSGSLNRLYVAVFGGPAAGPFNAFSLAGVIFVAALHGFAFVYFLTYTALRGIDDSYEQAARISGSTRAHAVLRVTLPLVTPAIAAGALFSAAHSTIMLGIQIFLGVPGGIRFLATRLFGMLQGIPADYAGASAIGVVLVLLLAAGIIAQKAILGRKSFVTVGGKSGSSELWRLGRFRMPAVALSGVVILVAFVLPVGMLLVTSLRENWLGTLSLATLTPSHYREILLDGSTREALVNSVLFAGIAAFVCVIAAFFATFINQRTELRGRKVLDVLMTIPLGLPGVALAVGLLIGWLQIPVAVYGTMWIMVLAYVASNLPYALQTTGSGMRQIDVGLEEAARISGASWTSMIRHVSLPLLRPSLAVAWIFVFVPAFADVTATLLLYSPGSRTIGVAIFDFRQQGQVENMSALAIIGMTVTLVLAGLANWIGARQRNQSKR